MTAGKVTPRKFRLRDLLASTDRNGTLLVTADPRELASYMEANYVMGRSDWLMQFHTDANATGKWDELGWQELRGFELRAVLALERQA